MKDTHACIWEGSVMASCGKIVLSGGGLLAFTTCLASIAGHGLQKRRNQTNSTHYHRVKFPFLLPVMTLDPSSAAHRQINLFFSARLLFAFDGLCPKISCLTPSTRKRS